MPESLRDLLASATVLRSELEDAKLTEAARLMGAVIYSIRHREREGTTNERTTD